MNISDNLIVNNAVAELFLEGEGLEKLLHDKVCLIVEHQPASNNEFFVGICKGATWNNNKRICAAQLTYQSSINLKIIPLRPFRFTEVIQLDNNASGEITYNIRGYIVLNNNLTEVHQKGIKLHDVATELNSNPLINNFMRNDFIYCDPETGHDLFPGTLAYPTKTLQRALMFGKRIKIKAGTTIPEFINIGKESQFMPFYNTSSGIPVIDKYGEGENPILSGERVLKQGGWVRGSILNGEWVQSKSGNVWMLDLSDASNFVSGYDGANSQANNVGTLINTETKQFLGARRVFNISHLKTNFDLYQPLPPKNTYDYSYFNKIYVYCATNLNLIPLSITSGHNGFTNHGAMINIKNIDFHYWGYHGMAIGSNTIINKCNIYGCGGSYQLSYSDDVCYGNGIEAYVTSANIAQNIQVYDCNVSYCFDAGITVQGTRDESVDNVVADDILFENITIEQCRYGIETFITIIPRKDIKNNHILKELALTTVNPTIGVHFDNCTVKANTHESPAFRRTDQFGNEGEERKWAVRTGSDYFTGITIRDCYFKTPDLILSSYKCDDMLGIKLYNCTAEIGPRSILLHSKQLLELPSYNSDFFNQALSLIKRFNELCAGSTIAFNIINTEI